MNNNYTKQYPQETTMLVRYEGRIFVLDLLTMKAKLVRFIIDSSDAVDVGYPHKNNDIIYKQICKINEHIKEYNKYNPTDQTEYIKENENTIYFETWVG